MRRPLNRRTSGDRRLAPSTPIGRPAANSDVPDTGVIVPLGRGTTSDVPTFLSRSRTEVALVSVLAAPALWLAAPSSAQACGGTFCDAGPSVMPVDQTGENVMFVVADGQVEAHIQIQYTGDPERFAWIVPVMAEPTVEVGSDLLFTALQDATVPTFTVSTRTEGCSSGGGGGAGGGGGCGVTLQAERPASFDEDVPVGGEDEGEPTVRQRDLAGSYEYVVLEGGSTEGIVGWLDENGFAQDDDAPPILQDYIDDGFLFVAFKLRSGHGVDQIHPIVLRYPGNEACVPMRLTRIAARDDMGVRTFFLGDDRVAPTNFRHVQLNPVKFDWEFPGANYEEAVSLAVDEEAADGHAFVTEYAGSSDIVSPSAFTSDRWQSEPFRATGPADLTALLAQHDLMTCLEGSCYPTHPLVPSLLQDYVPPPPGVPPEAFYACSSCYADWQPEDDSLSGTTGGIGDNGSTSDTRDSTDGTAGETGSEGSTGGASSGMSSDDSGPGSTGEDTPAPDMWADYWDTEGLADALEEQVVAPSHHAAALVQEFPYLTRMYTTLSPAEMTRDPLFSEMPSLPEVDNVWSATRFSRCDGPDRVELDSGPVIWFTESDDPPTFSEMPYARVVEQFFTGAPMTLRDHGATIDAELAAWNEEHRGPEITPDDVLDDRDDRDDGDEGFCNCTSTNPVRGSGTFAMLLTLGLFFRKRPLPGRRPAPPP